MMNKDLSTEYKEAVMNDLPDLWGRIEAAVDALESEEKIHESKQENSNVTGSIKESVVTESEQNAVVTQFPETKSRKRKRIPGWVMVGLPSVAILMVAVVPLFMWMSSGGNSKSATMMAPSAASDSAECYSEAAAFDSVDSDSAGYFGGAEASNSANGEDYAKAIAPMAEEAMEAGDAEEEEYDSIALQDCYSDVYVVIESFDSDTRIADIKVKGLMYDAKTPAQGSDKDGSDLKLKEENYSGITLQNETIENREIKVIVPEGEIIDEGGEYKVNLYRTESENEIIWIIEIVE